MDSVWTRQTPGPVLVTGSNITGRVILVFLTVPEVCRGATALTGPVSPHLAVSPTLPSPGTPLAPAKRPTWSSNSSVVLVGRRWAGRWGRGWTESYIFPALTDKSYGPFDSLGNCLLPSLVLFSSNSLASKL